jgi:hypothetical protein
MDYLNIYNNIIQKAKKCNRVKNKEIYYEAHHIIPKCMGGTGKTSEWRTHENIVLLTPKEHFLCHMLLCEIYPNNIKLYQSLWLMSTNKNKKTGKRYKVSSRTYERIKTKASKIYQNKKISKLELKKRSQSQKKTWYKKRKEQGLIIDENHIEDFIKLYPNIELSKNNKHCINYCYNNNLNVKNIICKCNNGIKRFQNYTQGYKQYCSRKCSNLYNKEKSLQTKENNGLWDNSKERLRRKEIKNLSKEEIEQLRRKRISNKQKDKPKSGNSHGKPIYQFDLQENFIQEWPSIRQAGFSLVGNQGESIRKCLKGLQKTAYGFIWKYKN